MSFSLASMAILTLVWGQPTNLRVAQIIKLVFRDNDIVGGFNSSEQYTTWLNKNHDNRNIVTYMQYSSSVNRMRDDLRF